MISLSSFFLSISAFMLNEHILNAISSTHGIVRNRYKTHCWQKQDSWCNHEECGKEMKKCLASGQQKKKKEFSFCLMKWVKIPTIVWYHYLRSFLCKGKKVQAEKNYSYWHWFFSFSIIHLICFTPFLLYVLSLLIYWLLPHRLWAFSSASIWKNK